MPVDHTAGWQVAGVVLAAGRSHRMGRDKALLDADGRPFVARAARCLADGGARPVFVVTRDAANAAAVAARDAGARVVVNPAPDHPERGGPISSVRLALLALGAADGVGGGATGYAHGLLVLPVDHPRVRADTVRALIDAFDGDHTPVVVPAWRGRRGHPVLIARSLFVEAADDDLAEGLRTLVRRHDDARVVVPVDDPGVVDDLDTPGEYRAVYGADPAPARARGSR